jgi:hypothetical protein
MEAELRSVGQTGRLPLREGRSRIISKTHEESSSLPAFLGVLARKRCCGGLVDQPEELSVGWAN